MKVVEFRMCHIRLASTNTSFLIPPTNRGELTSKIPKCPGSVVSTNAFLLSIRRETIWFRIKTSICKRTILVKISITSKTNELYKTQKHFGLKHRNFYFIFFINSKLNTTICSIHLTEQFNRVKPQPLLLGRKTSTTVSRLSSKLLLLLLPSGFSCG